jgi:hypothetical protein
MSLAQEKEDLQMVERFKKVVCQNCKSWKLYCNEDKDDRSFILCPCFFNYKMYGRPVIRLSDFSYNAPPQKDLRIED